MKHEFSHGPWSVIVDELGFWVVKKDVFQFRTRSLREAIRKAKLERKPLIGKGKAIIVDERVAVFSQRRGFWVQSALLFTNAALFVLRGFLRESWFIAGSGILISGMYLLLWSFPWERGPIWDWRWTHQITVREKELFEALQNEP